MRPIWVPSLLLLASTSLLLAGCGSKDTTVLKTDSGKVEIKETNEGEAKWSFEGKDPQGKDISGKYSTSEKDGLKYEDSTGQKLTMGGDFDASELGVPTYPNAKIIGERSGLRSEKDKEVTVMASYSTTDDYSKVIEFYDKRFEGAQKSSLSAGTELSTYTRNKDDDNISVIVTKVDGQVTIGMTRMFKKK
jgi:hypothetical protein